MQEQEYVAMLSSTSFTQLLLGSFIGHPYPSKLIDGGIRETSTCAQRRSV